MPIHASPLRWSFVLLVVLATLAIASVPRATAHPFPPVWGDGSGPAVHYPPVAWPTDASWHPYTLQSSNIADPRTQDPSNGGTLPQNYVNVSSSCIDRSLPSVYWQYDPAGKTIFFRWRVEQIANTYATGPSAGSYAATDPWNSALWTVLIDTTGDGYRDFAVHLNGSSGSPATAIDQLVSIYSNTRSQSIDYVNDANIHLLKHNPTALVDDATNKILNFQNSLTPTANWPNGSSETVWDYGTTRSTQLARSSSCNEYLIDYQIPLAMLDASGVGGPQVKASTPISFMFATSNSLNNPLQKDVVYNGDYIADPNAPAPFGDTVTLDGGANPQPIVEALTVSGCGPVTLSAQINDALDFSTGTPRTSVAKVNFFSYADRNANGQPDDGSPWVIAAAGSTTDSPVGRWTANWNSTSLQQGQYLIGVQATDRQGNITWSYLSASEIAATIGPEPPNYANPAPSPGVVYATLINSCGAPPPSLTKSVNPTQVAAGGTTQFTLTVHNPTTEPLTVGSITDPLPAGFSYISTDGGTLGSPTTSPTAGASGTIEWTFSPAVSVPAGGASTLVFTARVSSIVNTYSNVASSSTSAGTLTSLPAQIGVGAPRLTISKAANVSSANPGDQIVYTITYANDSPVNVTNATLTDSLPLGLGFVSADNGGAYDSTSGTVSWNVGSIASGDGPFTVHVTATVINPYPAAAAVPLINTATIRSTETVPASTSTPVMINAPRPVLTIQKDANVTQITPGTTSAADVVFTIRYANSGNAEATNVVITDAIPAGFSFVSADDGGVNTDGTVAWNVGTVATGATGAVHVTLRAISPYTGTDPATNTATIRATGVPAVSDSFRVGVTQPPTVCQTYYFRSAASGVGVDGTQRIATTTPLTNATASTINFNATTTAAEAIRFYSDPPTSSDVNFAGSLTTGFYIDKANGPQLKLDAYVYDYNPQDGARRELGRSSFTSTGSGTNQLYSFTVPTSGTLTKGHRLLWKFDAYSNQSTSFTFRFDGTASPSNAQYCVTAPANLVLDKQVDTLSIQPGGTLGYTIKFANTGQTNTSGTQIVDSLPAGTTFISGQLNGIAVTPVNISGQQYTFDVRSGETSSTPPMGQVTGGQSGTLVIRVAVDQPLSASLSSLTNTAILQSTQTASVIDSVTTRIVRPNVVVTKAADKSLLVPGDTVTFTLSVLNAGTGTATNVTLNDVLPTTSYFSYVAGSAELGDTPVTPDPVTGGVLNLNLGSLESGASKTVALQMRVASAGVPDGLITRSNTATVSDAQTSGQRSSEAVVISISTNPNLRLIKSTTPGPVQAGSVIRYTMTVENVGSGTASDVVVYDPLPTNARYQAGSLADETTGWTDIADGDAAEFDAASNRVVFHLDALPGGSTRTIHFDVRINTPLVAGTTSINNLATVSASNAASKQGLASVNAVAAPNLVLHKTAPSTLAFPLTTLAAAAASTATLTVNNPTFMNVGDVISVNGVTARIVAINGTELTLDNALTGNTGDQVLPTFEYVLSYQNTGTASASGVIVRDALATGLMPISADNGGTWSGSTVSWTLPTVAPGDTGSLRVRVRPEVAATYSNTASISSNETASVSSNTTTTSVGGLDVSKVTSTPRVNNTASGAEATYVITLRNQLATTADAVIVTDQLAPGFTYARTVAVGGNASRTASQDPMPGDSFPSWGTWQILGNGSLTITFVAQIASTVGEATYQNQVTASSTNTSVLPFDALATTAEDVRVINQPNLTATKQATLFEDADSSGVVSAGDTLQYSVTITNSGNAAASSVVFSDTPGTNTALVSSSVTTSAGSISDDTSKVGVNIGSLNAGASVTIRFLVTIDNPLPVGVTQVGNQGIVSSAELPNLATDDPTTTAPNDPTVTLVVQPPDLALTISDRGASAQPGNDLTYVLSYSNSDAQDATGVQLNIEVPANTTFHSSGSTSGWRCTPDGSAGSVCTLAVGSLNRGAAGTAQFGVTINSAIPGGVTQITATATIQDDGSHGIDSTPSNNTASEATPFTPTAVTLLSFTAQRVDGRVEIRWETAAEFNTQGFKVYRSSDRNRAHAELLTPVPVPAQGRGLGYAYVLIDTTAESDVTYNYWLQEIDRDSTTTEYGPATLPVPHQIWLPLVVR